MGYIQTDQQMLGENQQIARCGDRDRKSTKHMPAELPAPAFLKYRFLPLMNRLPELRKAAQVQKDYFRSEANLAALYRLAIPQTEHLPYPQNIRQSFIQLQKQVDQLRPHLSLAIVQGKEGQTTLVTIKPVDIHYRLYYIPVMPLYRLLRRPKAKHVAPLTMSLVAYILQKMKIHYYRNPGSYIAGVYETLEEWLDDTEAERGDNDFTSCKREFKRAAQIGDYIYRKLRNPHLIAQLPVTTASFTPLNRWEAALKELAIQFIRLDLIFPHRRLSDEIPDQMLEPQEEERIYKEQYLSFVFDFEGWLGNQMVDHIETSLQELSVADLPLTLQSFDTPQSIEHHDQTYENTTLELLSDFAHLLNQLDYEKY